MAFTSLSELRKSRSGFESLMKEVEKISNPQSEKQTDERFWQPVVDKEIVVHVDELTTTLTRKGQHFVGNVRTTNVVELRTWNVVNGCDLVANSNDFRFRERHPNESD